MFTDEHACHIVLKLRAQVHLWSLVDCDHIVQWMWKLAHDRIGWCLGYLHAKSDQDRTIVVTRIQLRKSSVEKCGVFHFGIIQQFTCRTVSASAELLVLLFYYSPQREDIGFALCVRVCVRFSVRPIHDSPPPGGGLCDPSLSWF